MPSDAPPLEIGSEPRDGTREGFHWLRWTVIGCAAWFAYMLFFVGSIFAAIFLMPVAGPIGGWLVGGTFYLLGGLLKPG